MAETTDETTDGTLPGTDVPTRPGRQKSASLNDVERAIIDRALEQYVNEQARQAEAIEQASSVTAGVVRADAEAADRIRGAFSRALRVVVHTEE